MEEVKEMKEIRIVVEGESLDFETAKKIAEVIAEYFNKSIKAWWDNCDGDHEPAEIDEWDKTLERLGVDMHIDVDGQYSFYC